MLDPAIRDWVLIPIMIVMLEIGILRHYITQLLSSPTSTSSTQSSQSGGKQGQKGDVLKSIKEAQVPLLELTIRNILLIIIDKH